MENDVSTCVLRGLHSLLTLTENDCIYEPIVAKRPLPDCRV